MFNFQEAQDVLQLLCKKPTKHTKAIQMPIKKKMAERHLQKMQEKHPIIQLSRNTRQNHMPIKEKVAEGHLAKHKTSTQTFHFQEDRSMPQLLRKKPTQNTKQNHMLIQKKVAECHLPKIQDKHPITQLSGRTKQAPAAAQETDTEHKAKP